MRNLLNTVVIAVHKKEFILIFVQSEQKKQKIRFLFKKKSYTTHIKIANGYKLNGIFIKIYKTANQ